MGFSFLVFCSAVCASILTTSAICLLLVSKSVCQWICRRIVRRSGKQAVIHCRAQWHMSCIFSAFYDGHIEIDFITLTQFALFAKYPNCICNRIAMRPTTLQHTIWFALNFVWFCVCVSDVCATFFTCCQRCYVTYMAFHTNINTMMLFSSLRSLAALHCTAHRTLHSPYSILWWQITAKGIGQTQTGTKQRNDNKSQHSKDKQTMVVNRLIFLWEPFIVKCINEIGCKKDINQNLKEKNLIKLMKIFFPVFSLQECRGSFPIVKCTYCRSEFQQSR